MFAILARFIAELGLNEGVPGCDHNHMTSGKTFGSNIRQLGDGPVEQGRVEQMKNLRVLLAASILLSPVVLTVGSAHADDTVVVARKCFNGVCGSSKYYGGKVHIKVSSMLSRWTHFNFKTNPGDQIEIGGTYSFDQEPGNGGTYSAQSCDRGGIGARSTCTKWATFNWSSGGQEESGEQ